MSDFDRLMGDSLKAIRDDHVREIEAQVPAARRQIAAKARRRRFTFVLGGTAIAAASVAAFVFISQTVPNLDRSEPIRPSGTPAVLARIDVPGVGAMEAGLERLWVAHGDGLVGIDPAASAIAIESPTDVDHMAMDSEAVFSIDIEERTLSRLPFGTNEAATGTTMEGTPTLVAASEETIWVATDGGHEATQEILTYSPDLETRDSALRDALEGRVIADMLYADGALWMTATSVEAGAYEVHRYTDDGDHTIFGLSPSEGPPAEIAVGEGAAWILRQPTEGGGNTITRIDLENDQVVERAVTFEDSIESITAGEGYLWATTAPTGMNMPPDTKASLHRVDPTTLRTDGEPLEVAGPGSKLAVGYGYVWIGDPNNKQIVQVDPYGQSSPKPTASPEITPDDKVFTDQDCATFLPFLSTDADAQLGLGSGGQADVPLADQNPSALVHWSLGQGRYIDFVAGSTVWAPVDEEEIAVLGRPARSAKLHRIEDGFAVTFQTGGCAENQLVAYGLGETAVRDFVATLTLRGHAETSYDTFALWPETTPEDAYESCLLVAEGAEPFRTDGGETALEFARDQLGWTDAELTENPVVADMEQGYELFTVIPGSLEDPPRVGLVAREVAPDCWSVSSVGTAVSTGARTALSVSKTGSRLRVGFDLALRGLEDAATILIPVEDGRVSMTADEFRSAGQQIEGVFRNLSEGGPAGFLVLIEDRNGQVIGAIGQALPSGDFTAG